MEELDKKFIKSIKINYPKNYEKIIDAYKFANLAHSGLKRKSGEPYIIHPLAIARILMENNMDYATIMAGLLHDVVEDTSVTLEEINEKFGETVARLVDGVTKIDSLDYKNYTEDDNIKRLIIAMGSDIRVIFIKLADRLHNMRTIEFLSRERQIRIAKETNELFIPIAERIGIRNMRSELEALTFKCLHPDEYSKIKKDFDRKFDNHEKNINSIEKTLNKVLKEADINANIIGWRERYYSIYKKLNNQGFSKFYGLMLYKIIVPTESDCYKALGLLHKTYNHIPNQIKDFISSPKPNGYKSLQTVLIDNLSGVTFKVMIRTPEMDKICEYGISSLWQDKDSEEYYDETFEKYNKLKEIVLNESFQRNNSSRFIDAIKRDLVTNSTWVFTPKFKPICMNVDAPTAIDFAYAVHTSIGHNAVGAIVNEKKVSLGTLLKNGDVVEILVSDKDKAPSRNWLSVVKTSVARKKIREYIVEHTTPKFVKLGKLELEKELAKINHSLGEVIDLYPKIQDEFNFVNIEDMYASIGYKSITISQVLKFVLQKEEATKCKLNSPVIVEGSELVLDVIFPRCCGAIPGDKIVGVLSKNKVAIHNHNCVNIKNLNETQKLQAKWKDNISQSFNVNLKIVAKDALGYGARLLTLIAEQKHNMTKLEARKVSISDCEFIFGVNVKNLSELNNLIEKIKTIKEVKTITRYFG